MRKKPFAWSYSALDSFELCPKKYAAEKIYRTAVSKPSEAIDYGKTVHAAFEHYLLKSKPLPLDLVHHAPKLDYLKGVPGEPLVEQRLALTKELNPTGFFDDDVWLRGVIDYAKYDEDKQVAIIVDHKTGKMKDEFDQLELMAAILQAYKPTVRGFALMYYWTKTKRFTKQKLLTCDITGVWNKFLPRVKNMESRVEAEDFPARPNFLCKNHCPVKNCVHNGG